jgi:hypothetical protein
MKKYLFLSVVLVTALAMAGVVGLAYAQTAEPETPSETTTCPRVGAVPFGGPGQAGGMLRGRGMSGMGFGTMGSLHEYFNAAAAYQLGLTAEQLAEQLAGGETIRLIAEAQGMTLAQYREMINKAHAEGLANAVADEVLTQQQADQMLERMQSRAEKGFGLGTGRGKSGFHGGQR